MSLSIMMATIALIGGTLWTGNGERVEGATVLIEGNRIIQVGRKIPIPTGAIIKECHGRVITPGLIDAYTQLGLVEISGVGTANDTRPDTEYAVRSHLSAADAMNPNSFVLAQQVEYGLLSAGTHLSGGLISGQLAAVNLVTGEIDDALAGINLSLGGQSGQSRAQRLALIHDAFEQARAWQKNKTISNRPEQLSIRQLKVLSRLLSGEGRVFVEAHRQSDIEHALAMGARYKLKLVIVGGHEAWRVARRLAKTRTPVIINPVHNLPSSFDSLLIHPDGITKLIDAGVDVAISTLSTHQARKLRQWAGNAIRGGMSYPDAVRAVTVIPAEILGLPQSAGIKPGAIADLVVWSGDPFELSSFPAYRIKGGKLINVPTRQKALLTRYRCLDQSEAKCKYALPADPK
jgi:imidazolonepropionase-like amidohydrolase